MESASDKMASKRRALMGARARRADGVLLVALAGLLGLSEAQLGGGMFGRGGEGAKGGLGAAECVFSISTLSCSSGCLLRLFARPDDLTVTEWGIVCAGVCA